MDRETLNQLDTDNNKISKNKILQIILFSTIVLLLLEYLKAFLPNSINISESFQFETIELFALGIYILVAILLTTNLNNMQPKLSKGEIFNYTAIIVTIIELISRLLRNFLFTNNGLNLDYLGLIKDSVVIGSFALLISNIQINRLRNESIVKPILAISIPVIVALGIWALARQYY